MDQSFDIMENIFSRLPIKSILACKSVCRYWYSTISNLISSSNFLYLQAHQTLKKPKLWSLSILITSPAAAIDYRACLGNKDDIKKAWKNRHSPEIFGKDFTLMGSYNGLICLHDKLFNVFLWNPCTGSFATVKKNYRNKERNPYLFYGFGANLSAGGYVVVLGGPFFDCDQNIKPGYKAIGICVMNNELGRYVWKFIQYIRPYRVFEKIGVRVNEYLHWPASFDSRGKVISYNLNEEKFQEFEVPAQINSFWRRKSPFTVGNFRGYLSTIFKVEGIFEIWIMKKYGVKESWTWLVNIEGFGLHDILVPLGFLWNYDIILQGDRYLIARYSFRDKTVQILKLHGGNKCSAVSFMDSLVAPNN